MERMVKVIVQLSIQAVSAPIRRAEQAGIVEIAFRDEVNLPIEPLPPARAPPAPVPSENGSAEKSRMAWTASSRRASTWNSAIQ